ncbi:MAG: hypothetical protein M1294_11890 [Firmicutes bacterium]|nr:hypothetical protein [Bacillota bacterium]
MTEQDVKELQDTHNATLVPREHPLSPSMVRRSVREARQRAAESPEGLPLTEENAQLKRLVIDRDMEIMVLKDARRKMQSDAARWC